MVTYFEVPTLSTAYILAGAQARASAQNSAGGVKGRRIEIIGCNTKFDLAASEACARSAVSMNVDGFIHGAPLVAAPVGSGIFTGVSDTTTVLPILAGGGIPFFGTFLTAGGPEATSPNSFPYSSTNVSIAGVAVAMANEGCRRMAFLGTTVGREPFRRGLASKGLEPAFEALFAQIDPAAIMPVLAQRNVDCVYLGTLESGIRNFVLAAERAGQSFRVGWVNDFVSEKGLASLGPSIDGAIVSNTTRSGFDLSDPAVRQYRAELDSFNKGIRYDTGGFGVWGATDLLMQAMRGINGDVTAASTLSALRSFKGVTALFGPVDFTNELRDPLFRRMFIANAFTYRIVNAKPVLVDAPLDLRSLFDKVP
jgi:hypothetical protein